jgi:hypothetical protein
LIHVCEDSKAENTSAVENIIKKMLPAAMKDIIYSANGIGCMKIKYWVYSYMNKSPALH